jgi:multidrug efflux pump subunit AcrA (membrane-fusion protein)
MKTAFILVSLLSLPALAAKPQVATQKLELTMLKQTLLYPAVVRSRVESNIKADSDLIVVKNHVTLGQRVKKGETLLELKQQDSSLNYNNRLIKAPVDGIVAGITVTQGQYVSRGEDLLLLNEPQRLFLKLELPVSHHKDVQVGLKVQLSTKETALITGVGSVTDSVYGTIPVEIELSEAMAKNYISGSIQNVEIILGEKQNLLVSEKALYFSGEKVYLPTLVEGKVKKNEVTGVSLTKGQFEIQSGANVGDEIIVGSGEFLKDGDEVEVAKKM